MNDKNKKNNLNKVKKTNYSSGKKVIRSNNNLKKEVNKKSTNTPIKRRVTNYPKHENKLIDLEQELKKDLSLDKKVSEIVPVKVVKKIVQETTIEKIIDKEEIPVENKSLDITNLETKDIDEKLINEKEYQESIDLEPLIDNKETTYVKEEPKHIEERTIVSKNEKKRTKSFNLIIIFVSLIILVSLSFIVYKVVNDYYENKHEEEIIEQNKQKLASIKSHYNIYVKTNKEAKIYKLDNDKYKEYGKINKDNELTLYEIKDEDFTIKTEYFKITNLDLYIKYSDVDKITNLTFLDNHYKKYIVFNTNIITNNTTNFYNDKGLVYSINKAFNLPIIIKDTDKYYVEYNNQLLYIKKEDVKETMEVTNTNQKTRTNIRTLTYHFVVADPTKDVCDNPTICHSAAQFDSHIKYFADNNYLALTMKDMELFLDKKIQIPVRSILITIDDGWLAQNTIPILEKYKVNATLFVITGTYNPTSFKSSYLELHSHSNDLHNPGVCKGGLQGGGILCLPRETLLADLKKSRDSLNGSTVFCYPFYDYNDYAISVLQEAGFKMAFIGTAGVKGIASQNVNKFKIPRSTVLATTTMNEFLTLVDY